MNSVNIMLRNIISYITCQNSCWRIYQKKKNKGHIFLLVLFSFIVGICILIHSVETLIVLVKINITLNFYFRSYCFSYKNITLYFILMILFYSNILLSEHTCKTIFFYDLSKKIIIILSSSNVFFYIFCNIYL